MALALFFVARLAIRLIHPEAGWFAVFACLALGGVNYHAADARPYALGFCMAAGSLLWLVRWLDRGRLVDGMLFVVFASLLWRVHLLFWPMYIVFALYAVLRRGARIRTAIPFVCLRLLCCLCWRKRLPCIARRGPRVRAYARPARSRLRPEMAPAGFLRHRGLACPARIPLASAIEDRAGCFPCPDSRLLALPALVPLRIFPSYGPQRFRAALPVDRASGGGSTATLAASYFVPAARWRPLSLVLGAAALLWLGQWRILWPLHHNSDWRTAAQTINRLPISEETPVLCPSPFLEAIPPAWSPGYPLSGFFYSHLAVYPVRGRIYALPFTTSPEAERLARTVSRDFVLYGWEPQVHFWRDWLAAQPQFQGWRQQRLGPFADVDVVLFQAPLTASYAGEPGKPAPGRR
jgi:hypothetical protein